MKQYIDLNFRIVMLDEMMMTKSTFPKQEWSSLKTNFKLEISKTPTEAIAVLVAVSRERGLEHFM